MKVASVAKGSRRHSPSPMFAGKVEGKRLRVSAHEISPKCPQGLLLAETSEPQDPWAALLPTGDLDGSSFRTKLTSYFGTGNTINTIHETKTWNFLHHICGDLCVVAVGELGEGSGRPFAYLGWRICRAAHQQQMPFSYIVLS